MATQNCVVLSLQKQSVSRQVWWLMPITPAFRRQRQRDCQEFKANLSFIVRLSQRRMKEGNLVALGLSLFSPRRP